MNKLITYNRVVFTVGGFFTKLWMITMPLFILYLTFGDVTPFDGYIDSLWLNRSQSWPMLVFYWFIFLGFYPVRNYLEVDRVLKGASEDEKLAQDFKTVVETYKSLKK